MQVSKPSYREKEAGGLCGKPQATLSCMLIKILPHQRVYCADTTRDEESAILMEDRQQIRSQCSSADGCVRENRAER